MQQPIVSSLAPRQQEALLLTAKGFSRKEAARQMKCSAQNVVMLLEAVRFKLHARTVAEAVSVAYQRGILRLMAFLLTVSTLTAMFPAPAAQASDDDPLVRRVRARPSGRTARRVRSGDQLADLSDFANQSFITFHGLEPVLVWDDGLYLVYQ